MTEYTDRGRELGLGNCAGKTRWAAGHLDDGLFIDVGAKIGAFFVPLLERTDARCLAFEPNPEAAALAREHARMNGVYDRVEVFELALMDKPGSAVLHVPEKDGLSGFATIGCPLRAESKPVRVNVSTLGMYDAPDIALIKIDVEGAERYVIEGGRCLIEKHHPILIIECQRANTRQFGYEPEVIEGMVSDMGYEWERSGNDILCVR